MKLPLAVMLYYLRDYCPVTVAGNPYEKYIESFQLLTCNPSFVQWNICYICENITTMKKALDLISGNIFFCIQQESFDISEFKDKNNQNVIIFFHRDTTPTEILNRMIFIFTSLVQWDKECHRIIIEGCSLQELMQMLDKICTFPAAVFQPDFHVIGYTDMKKNSPEEFRRLIRLGQTPDSLMPEISRKQIPLRLKNNETAIYMPSAENPSFYYIYRKHRKNAEIIAYSCIFSPLEEPDEDFLVLTELFFKNVDFYFKNNEKYDKLGNYMYEGLLEKFLSDKLHSLNTDILSQMDTLHMPVHGEFLLVQIELENSRSSHLTYIRKLLYESCRLGKPFIFNESLYMLFLFQEKDHNPPWQDIQQEIQKALYHYKFICFISNPFFYMPCIYDARQQCRFVNEIYMVIKKDHISFYAYEDYMMYHLFSALEEHLDLNSVLPPDFFRFQQWDSCLNQSVSKILRVYLEQNMSFRKCAELLNIHRNTAEYQIRKIENTLNLDFSDNKIRQQFLLAFQITGYLNSKKNKE